MTTLIKDGMEAGGPAPAFERFIRFAAGDANWEGLDPSAQEGMLASADTYFGIESGAFDTYLPDDETLAAIATPTQLLVSEGSLLGFAQAAGRLSERLGIEITRTPGTHFPYLDRPRELAVKPFLRGSRALEAAGLSE